MLLQSDEHRARTLMEQAKHDVQERWGHYQQRVAEAQHGENRKEHD
jgi:hypothetical protein